MSKNCTLTILSNLFSNFSNPCMSFPRARLVNYIKTSEVVRQPYPLQIRSNGPHTYFLKRETWGWTDFLMNPMVNMRTKLKMIERAPYCLEDSSVSTRTNVFIWTRKDSQKGYLVLQVMMMVLPLLIIVLLPKVVNTNDPEMRKVRNLCQSYCADILLSLQQKCIVWNSFQNKVISICYMCHNGIQIIS